MTEDARQVFYSLAGQDAEIDAFELRDILNKVFQRGSLLRLLLLLSCALLQFVCDEIGVYLVSVLAVRCLSLSVVLCRL